MCQVEECSKAGVGAVRAAFVSKVLGHAYADQRRPIESTAMHQWGQQQNVQEVYSRFCLQQLDGLQKP
jgi:hypothetical protein